MRQCTFKVTDTHGTLSSNFLRASDSLWTKTTHRTQATNNEGGGGSGHSRPSVWTFHSPCLFLLRARTEPLVRKLGFDQIRPSFACGDPFLSTPPVFKNRGGSHSNADGSRVQSSADSNDVQKYWQQWEQCLPTYLPSTTYLLFVLSGLQVLASGW